MLRLFGFLERSVSDTSDLNSHNSGVALQKNFKIRMTVFGFRKLLRYTMHRYSVEIK
jgi:hypothetical protein